MDGGLVIVSRRIVVIESNVSIVKETQVGTASGSVCE
jgi:hypothetical protein